MGKKKRNGLVWKGPEEDGITYSLLSRFLVCRERFRLLVVEGLKPAPSFNHRIEYGSMWHVCEESIAIGGVNGDEHNPYPPWKTLLECRAKDLCRKYPTQQEQVQHWYNVCKTQFPIYVNYWSKHPDVKGRTPLLQEQTFDVPYTLPSGRVARLRGKWDSVDLIGKGKTAGVYLQENKTKGDIDEQLLQRQLSSGFDLQTMLYLVALQTQFPPGTKCLPKGAWDNGIRGVRYNVVRRPLSGGKGSIRKHQPAKANPQGETDAEFYERLGGIIAADPSYFFMRWKVEVSPQDIERFRRECLNPILEQLCDWWEWISGSCQVEREGLFSPGEGGIGAGLHWRHPFGVWNALNEGRVDELDEYLNSGSTLGLERTDNLFSELD